MINLDKYYITHPYTATNLLKINFEVGETVIQVDFSEKFEPAEKSRYWLILVQVFWYPRVKDYICLHGIESLEIWCLCSFGSHAKNFDQVCLSHPMDAMHILCDVLTQRSMS